MADCDVDLVRRREAVAKLARWLDEHWPTEEVGQDWTEVIDFTQLDMTECCRCVAGQLGAFLALYEGYHTTPTGDIVVGDRLTDGWSTLAYGFYESDSEVEKELAALLAKRLGVEFKPADGNQIIPRDFDEALLGETPPQYWQEEVEKRQ